MSDAPQTPELDKRSKVLPDAHRLGEFLDWLTEHKGITLAEWADDDQLYPASFGGYERLLAEFFGLDLDKIEAEKMALLEHLRAQQDG